MPEATDRGPESLPVMLPPHMGAVLKEGRSIHSAVDRWGQIMHGVEVFSATDEKQRRAWTFRNLNAFNALPTAPQVWKPAVDDYLLDLDTAQRNVERTKATIGDIRSFRKETSETKEFVKAAMAVSASARIMEVTGGNTDIYLQLISGSAEPGGNIDVQDSWREFLLHKNPEAYLRVINDPLVRHYYDRILRDAGLDPNPANEWTRDGRCSLVKLAKSAEEIRSEAAGITEESRRHSLAYYLKGKAKHGGFDGYVNAVIEDEETLADRAGDKRKIGETPTPEELEAEDFVLKQMSEEMDEHGRRAAAKLACDAFLVDKFTRWDYQLTAIGPDGVHRTEEEIYGKGNGIGLFPTKIWGGDPFRCFLEPSFLPRVIKGMYPNEFRGIFNIVDQAFRPVDIFFVQEPELAKSIVHPTAVENLKKLGRFAGAVGLFFGGSRAKGMPEPGMKEIGEMLTKIPELIDQVYQGKKELVGLMYARMLYAKALAIRQSMADPGPAREIFGPLTDPRKADAPIQGMEEMRVFLFGPHGDFSSGLVHSLATRTGIVFRGNKYGAEQVLKDAVKELTSTPEKPIVAKLRVAAEVAGIVASKR